MKTMYDLVMAQKARERLKLEGHMIIYICVNIEVFSSKILAAFLREKDAENFRRQTEWGSYKIDIVEQEVTE